MQPKDWREEGAIRYERRMLLVITQRLPMKYLALLILVVGLCIPAVSQAKGEESIPSEKQLIESLGGSEVLAAMRSSCRIEAVAVVNKKQGFVEKGRRLDLSPEQTAAVHQLLGDRHTYLNGSSLCIFDPGIKFILHPEGQPVHEWLICLHCGDLAVERKGEKEGFVSYLPGYKKVRELVKTIFAQDKDVQKAIRELEEEDKRREIEAKKRAEDLVRWQEATPTPLKDEKMRKVLEGNAFGMVDVKPLRQPLEKGIPDVHARIRALLTWYGSGAGPWSGFAGYEQAPEDLLLDYPTADILAAIQEATLTPAQTEGAARLFGGWTFSQKRPNDLKLLPRELNKALLEHVMQSKYEFNRDSAKHTFE